ncbi:hypothetical protein CHUAL_012495 [Chamberlinius hualienensis]
MATDWEEVKRLAADFQRAQLSSTVQRLSERNCIEIVNKLIEDKLIEVYYTTDGKEYVTPDQLLREVKDELYVEGGRIHLSELSRSLDIDYAHVETKSNELAKTQKDIYFILGQLIDRSYLDRIFEEVNEKLQQNGQISVADLTKQYDLPPDFLQQMLRERLGKIVKGQFDLVDQNIVFTDAFIARHKSRARGALLATTKPTHVNVIINRYGLHERIFFTVLDDLLSSSQLNGQLSGGKSEKTGVFIPDIYAKAQNEWVDSFLKQNHYLEYDALTRLGIGDPAGFIRKRYSKESTLKFLNSCVIQNSIIDNIEADIDLAVSNGSWTDVTTLCPSFFNTDDVQQVIQILFRQSKVISDTATVYCETVVGSNKLLQTLAQNFQTLMSEKAEQARIKGSFALENNSDSKKGATQGEIKKDVKKEERRKKAASGKGASGTQGRETKTKSTKKKYMKGRDSDDESDDGKTAQAKTGEIPFMSVSEIEKVIGKLEILEDSPSTLTRALAEILEGPLRQKYQEVARSIFMGSLASSSGSKKSHNEVQEKISALLGNINLFDKGIEIFSNNELKLDLRRHLLRTVCSNVVNILVSYVAQENMLSSDATENLTSELRTKIIGKLPPAIRDVFSRLNTTVNGKSLEEFLDALDAALSHDVCDIIVKKLDKKKEKLNVSTHYQSLLQQLSETSEPALVLHLAVLIIFTKANSLTINASGKFVPQILDFLHSQGHLNEDNYQLLHSYQELIIKHMVAVKNSENTSEVNELLETRMQSIKELAFNFRNKSKNS